MLQSAVAGPEEAVPEDLSLADFWHFAGILLCGVTVL